MVRIIPTLISSKKYLFLMIGFDLLFGAILLNWASGRSYIYQDELLIFLLPPIFYAVVKYPRWVYETGFLVAIFTVLWVIGSLPLNFLNSLKTVASVSLATLFSLELIYRAHRRGEQMAEELQSSQAELEAIIENAGDIIFTKNRQGEYQKVNAAFRRLFQLPQEKIIGKTDYDLFAPEMAAQMRHEDKLVLSGESIRIERKPIRDLDQIFDVSKTPIFNRDQEILGLCGIARDVTEQNQSEDALRASEERLRLIVETMREGLIMVDANTRITFLNDRVIQVLGYSREQIMNQDLSTFVDIGSREDLLARIDRRRNGISEQYDFPFRHQDGSIRWLIVSATPIFDSNNRYVGAISVLMDITERKKIEREREELIQKLQEALANIRRLSGLLPICCHCKKIRDDQGYWQQVEEFIMEHTEAELTHGLCPECAKKLYPELSEDL